MIAEYFVIDKLTFIAMASQTIFWRTNLMFMQPEGNY